MSGACRKAVSRGRAASPAGDQDRSRARCPRSTGMQPLDLHRAPSRRRHRLTGATCRKITPQTPTSRPAPRGMARAGARSSQSRPACAGRASAVLLQIAAVAAPSSRSAYGTPPAARASRPSVLASRALRAGNRRRLCRSERRSGRPTLPPARRSACSPREPGSTERVSPSVTSTHVRCRAGGEKKPLRAR